MHRPRTLIFITHELPWPNDTGHKIRTFSLLKELSQHFNVKLVGYTDLDSNIVRKEIIKILPNLLEVVAIGFHIRLRRNFRRLFIAIANSLRTSVPYSIAKFRSAACREVVSTDLQSDPDAILMTTLQMIVNFEHNVQRNLIFDYHDDLAALWELSGDLLNPLIRIFVNREARLLKRWEYIAWRKSSAICSICEEDSLILEKEAICPVVTVPVIIEAKDETVSAHPFDIGMIGVWSWAPNELALQHFARDLLSKIIESGLTVYIAGRGMSLAQSRKLTRLGAHVAGSIENVRDFYKEVKTIAAPYKVGSGVRVKIAEAISYGTPVIGYPLAFRGLQPALATEFIASDRDEMFNLLTDATRNNDEWRIRMRAYRTALEISHGSSTFTRSVLRLSETIDKGSRHNKSNRV